LPDYNYPITPLPDYPIRLPDYPIPPAEDLRLFTARFFVMCGFSFAVFFSVFELIPTAAFRIHDLGGGTVASGLFVGCLTFASAFSAPITGAISDRLGRKRTLLISSSVIGILTLGYALTSSYLVMLEIVVVHGLFWSALLSASAAHLTSLVPPHRRAEGLAYWGLSSVIATAAAPPLAFWLMQRGGWTWVCLSCAALNILMAAIASTLHEPRGTRTPASSHGAMLEWRVLALAGTLFLYSFGYGAITTFSAVYADTLGIAPKSIYLTTLGVVMLLTRPFSGRIADRLGYKVVFIPALLSITLGLGLLAVADSIAGLVVSASLFGMGFGTAYPVFVAYVMRDINESRRGAAFGAVLAAFDTGIGTGSIAVGWLIQRFGFSTAFGTAALLSLLAVPYFVTVDRRQHVSR
jgi:MFS family permease